MQCPCAFVSRGADLRKCVVHDTCPSAPREGASSRGASGQFQSIREDQASIHAMAVAHAITPEKRRGICVVSDDHQAIVASRTPMSAGEPLHASTDIASEIIS